MRSPCNSRLIGIFKGLLMKRGQATISFNDRSYIKGYAENVRVEFFDSNELKLEDFKMYSTYFTGTWYRELQVAQEKI